MLALEVANGSVRGGSAYLRDTPALAAHRGTQPDLFLTWNDFGSRIAAVDVVLYVHGFALAGGASAPLSDFVRVSGLDPDDGMALALRTRPTVALVARGDASATNPSGGTWPYRFPTLAQGGAMRLVSWCLDQLARARTALDPAAPASLAVDRLIVMGHSGAGRGILDALPTMTPRPDEIYLFDALYQSASPALTDWIAKAFAEDDERQRGLWIGYLSGTATEGHSGNVQSFIASALQAVEPVRAARLKQCFTVEKSTVSHMRVPRRYAWGLLADPPAAAGSADVVAEGAGPRTTPEQRLAMAKAIVTFEARRDANGHLAIYELPAGDGGGTHEVAGINDRFNKATVDALVALIRQGRFAEAEARAVDFIAGNTDGAAAWTSVPAVEFYLRDSLFNRGQKGAARILQMAVGADDDGVVGKDTRAALRLAERNVPKLLDALRRARERYERTVVGRNESSKFWNGLVNRWNRAIAVAKSFPMTAAAPATA